MKVSIITPVFNGIRFIEFCINNVIEQDCSCLEHIIIDGGSNDGTVEIIKQYAEKFPHIRWKSEKDKGQSDAMNKGIAMATGNILSFLNVDDYYEPGAINFILNEFKELPEPSLLVGNCKVWDDDGKLQSVNRPYKISLKNMLLEKYNDAYPFNPSAYFYHKSLHDHIGLYDVDDHYSMDMHFIYKSLKQNCVLYVDKTLGNFRLLANTKTSNDIKNGTIEARVKAINAYYLNSMSWCYRIYILILKYCHIPIRAITYFKTVLK